jgi:hypothetical protein
MRGEVSEVNQSVDGKLVDVALSVLYERCNMYFQRRQALIVSLNAVFEGTEDSPNPIGYLFDCHLTLHVTYPLGPNGWQWIGSRANSQRFLDCLNRGVRELDPMRYPALPRGNDCPRRRSLSLFEQDRLAREQQIIHGDVERIVHRIIDVAYGQRIHDQ